MAKSKGLLAAYGVDAEEIEAPSYEIDDGIYEFVIGNFFIQHGTKANPDGPDSAVVCYMLGDEGREKREFFNLPEDPDNITEAEEKKLGWFVSRMSGLGIDKAELNKLDEDELADRLIGLSGSLELFTQKGKKGTKNEGKEFQNIRKVRLDEESQYEAPEDDDEDDDDEEEEAPVTRKRTAPAAASKKPSTAKKASTKRANPFPSR